MSRFRKTLAAAAMAMATAGGGLLITAAGAVPAYASPPPAPSGGHAVSTITFQRAAPAASSPNVILPCAVKSPAAAAAAAATAGAAPADDTCDSGVITCDVIASNPILFGSDQLIFEAHTYCSDDVLQIRMGQDVIHSTPIDPNNPLTDSTVVDDDHVAFTVNTAVCQPGSYAVNAAARIVAPDPKVRPQPGRRQQPAAVCAVGFGLS
jgi:hypothetical protein